MTLAEFPLIVQDMRILLGKPTFKGTRISVEQVLQQLSGGDSIEEVLKDYPRLTRAHISQAFAFSAAMINFEPVNYAHG